MRNVLIHEYFGVDREEIWVAVERDVPTIKTELRKILRKLSEEETF